MTEFAMPPVMTMPSEDILQDDDNVAFKVLNQDNLPISIIGEAILKPFGRDGFKQKPNGIVYPTRRLIETPSNLDENKVFSRSNGHINTTVQDMRNNNTNNALNLKKNFSVSHGNLNSASKTKTENINQFDVKFTKTLDAKLRKLQKDTATSKKTNFETPNRKPFVTTVKKGQFLEPPPEIATLIGIKVDENSSSNNSRKEIKKLYAYSSEPRVLNRTPARSNVTTIHRLKCEAAAKAAASVVSSVAALESTNNNNNGDEVDANCIITKKPL